MKISKKSWHYYFNSFIFGKSIEQVKNICDYTVLSLMSLIICVGSSFIFAFIIAICLAANSILIIGYTMLGIAGILIAVVSSLNLIALIENYSNNDEIVCPEIEFV